MKLKQDQVWAFRISPLAGHSCPIFCNIFFTIIISCAVGSLGKDFGIPPRPRVNHAEYNSALALKQSCPCRPERSVRALLVLILTGVMQHDVLREPMVDLKCRAGSSIKIHAEDV